jgi:hypothetical protein
MIYFLWFKYWISFLKGYRPLLAPGVSIALGSLAGSRREVLALGSHARVWQFCENIIHISTNHEFVHRVQIVQPPHSYFSTQALKLNFISTWRSKKLMFVLFYKNPRDTFANPPSHHPTTPPNTPHPTPTPRTLTSLPSPPQPLLSPALPACSPSLPLSLPTLRRHHRHLSVSPVAIGAAQPL